MKKIRIFCNLSTTFLGFVFWVLISNIWVIHESSNFLYDNLDDLPERDVALVLGARMNGKYGINPYFRYRMEAAAELYHHGKVNRILVSGDNHVQTYDETTDMANYLITLGVPDHAIIRDYAGFRTLDSVVRAQKVFQCNSLIIVSQKFHNERAIFIAQRYGIDAVGYNARDVSSKSNYTHFRELIAKFGAVLDLYVFDTQPKFF